ncbi:hypothetical protein SDC9_152551 [bioreactor metagenome]|uniref:Uncharacterized protein n=1 Tax=bioreactor metagenome TaxID=1076179 RepID=A0A645ETD2_9ZZZZ
MSQVTAMGKIHTHDGVAWFQEGKINSSIGISAGMSLHVGMFSAKKFFSTFDSQRFNFIDVFTAAVITVSRIAFRVFIGQHGAHGFHNCRRYKVFGCNQLNFITLPA